VKLHAYSLCYRFAKIPDDSTLDFAGDGDSDFDSDDEREKKLVALQQQLTQMQEQLNSLVESSLK